MKVAIMLGILLLSFNDLAGQTTEPASVFKPAIDRVRSKTKIPILLPQKLPAQISEENIKLAWGESSESGYEIALYYEEIGSNASFAAGFYASTRVFKIDRRPVTLANGITAHFSPVSCGGSCAPANLVWKQSGLMYIIQIKLDSSMDEREQQRILVETANSMVPVRR